MRRSRFTALLVALLTACSGGPRPPERPPILLFAVDGLEWNVLLPMVQRGEAPAFRSLMERGVFGHLGTLDPTSSPIIWTTIATGKEPEQHGIHGFVYKDDHDHQQLYTSADRRVKAFWNILTDVGLDSTVLGWWITWPAERIRGLMVAQANTQPGVSIEDKSRLLKGSLYEGVSDQVFPPAQNPHVMEIMHAVDADLDGILQREYGLPSEGLPEPESRLVEATHWSRRADEIYLRLVLDRLSRGAPDALTAVYTGGTDVVGHRFWRYAYPDQFSEPVPADRVAMFGSLLHATYVRADQFLGKLLERLPDDATVIVVSDHGMQAVQQDNPFGPDDDLVSLLSGSHPHALPGVVIAAGSGIRRPATPPAIDGVKADDVPQIATVLDVTPTILALLGVAVGDDMPGQVRTEWIEPSWLEAHPVTHVPTYDTGDWAKQRERLRMQSDEAEQRLEQLRGLGYIGADESKTHGETDAPKDPGGSR